MLTSVVFVIHNLRRGHQSPEERGLTRLGGRAVVFPSQNPLVAGYSSPMAGFLIANPRLESKLSRKDPNGLQISNRERMAFCHFNRPSRLFLPRVLPATRHLLVLKADEGSLANAFLLVAPRLKSCVTSRKQNSNPISNRYKTALFAPLFHSSPITRQSPLTSVAPTSRKAIMCRNHFTQIPRSKPLMRKVTNADTNQS
jgi:hypothetical protein